MSNQPEDPVDKVLNIIELLLPCEVCELEYELPSGKIAQSMYVGRSEVVFKSTEMFGRGTEPYADGPSIHQEYLESEDAIGGEGWVHYDVGEEEPLKLPKTIYFEEAVSFENQILTDDPVEAIEMVNEELGKIVDGEIGIEVMEAA